MPTFLTIDNDDFDRVVKEIKKIDKELVYIVKDSKYSQEYIINKTQACLTEPNQPYNPKPTFKMSKTLRT